MTKLVSIGKIFGVFGIQGWVKIKTSSDADTLGHYKKLQLALNHTNSELKIAKSQVKNGIWLVLFDGVNDRINIANQHTGNVEFTIECWFKSDNTIDGGGGFHRIFTLGSTNRLEIGELNGKIVLHRFTSSNTTFPANTRDGKWHHLALLQKNQKISIFFDGQPLTQSINSSSIDLRGIRVGYFDNNNLTPNTMWKGGIDEIKLWNYGLSQEEINNSKNKINTKKKDCGLIGYWRMEEGIPGGNNQDITMIRDSVATNQGILVGFNLTGNTSNFVCNDSLMFEIDNEVDNLVHMIDFYSFYIGCIVANKLISI